MGWSCTSSLISTTNAVRSALGFAPPNASMPVYTDSKVPNLLHKVVAAGVLDRNVMTLDLPFRPGEKGSLTLGTAGEELQESNVISIPFSNGTGDGIRDKWQMRIESIGVTGANSTTIPLTSTYATFELGPGFSFPRNITRDILKALNAKDEGFIFPEVNCSRWDNMPDLHLSLSGQQITLERDDYAFKGYTPRGETCAISIGENWFDWEPVALGFEFLRKFFVVFDMDNAEFRCKLYSENAQSILLISFSDQSQSTNGIEVMKQHFTAMKGYVLESSESNPACSHVRRMSCTSRAFCLRPSNSKKVSYSMPKQ